MYLDLLLKHAGVIMRNVCRTLFHCCWCMWIFSDLRRQHKEIRSWLQLGGLRLVLAPRGSWWTPWFVCVASGRCFHYGHGYPCLGQ